MRIASSLTGDFSLFDAGVFGVVAFFRGERAFFAAGFAVFPFNAAPSDCAFSLSLTFAFFGMVKQVSLYPAESDWQAVFAKDWREREAFASVHHAAFRLSVAGNNGGSDGRGFNYSRDPVRFCRLANRCGLAPRHPECFCPTRVANFKRTSNSRDARIFYSHRQRSIALVRPEHRDWLSRR